MRRYRAVPPDHWPEFVSALAPHPLPSGARPVRPRALRPMPACNVHKPKCVDALDRIVNADLVCIKSFILNACTIILPRRSLEMDGMGCASRACGLCARGTGGVRLQ